MPLSLRVVGWGKMLQLLHFLLVSFPHSQGGLCLRWPSSPPHQLRESIQPNGSSPAWVPERLVRVCTFPSKEDEAHFATPSRVLQSLQDASTFAVREENWGLYKLRSPPNPLRASLLGPGAVQRRAHLI